MRFFCTYFDRNYLPFAVALHASLMRHCRSFRLFVLALDDTCAETMERLGLPSVSLLRLEELERKDAHLYARKSTRSLVDYYYTCGPSLIRYLFEREPEIELLTLIDADLYFFSSPEPIYQELEGSSVGIIEHRFGPKQSSLNRFGTYNVGWTSFRRDADGLACLDWWREQCLEWCFDRVEGNRFADQKYLNEFPIRFSGVRIIQQKGANVGPWNLASFQLSESYGEVWVAQDPLIFFHFHGFKILKPWLYNSNVGRFRVKLPPIARRLIFAPYIRELRDVAARVGYSTSIREKNRDYSTLVRVGRFVADVGLSLLTRAYIIQVSDRQSN